MPDHESCGRRHLAAVRTGPAQVRVFNNNVDPNLIDNAVGRQLGCSPTDDLASGSACDLLDHQPRPRSQVSLSVQPVTQTRTVGQTATITVTATDNIGTPYAGRPLVYSIGGS